MRKQTQRDEVVVLEMVETVSGMARARICVFGFKSSHTCLLPPVKMTYSHLCEQATHTPDDDEVEHILVVVLPA